MKNQFYTDSMPYEIFVRRAYKAHDYTKPGMKNSYFQNLMLAEINAPIVRHLDSYEKQLVTIKIYLFKAFDKFLKMKLNTTEKDKIILLRTELETAITSAELLQIIVVGLETTSRFKEY
jgi:hypothetical protein